MKKILFIFSLLAAHAGRAQETVLPVPKQEGTTVIRNVTVHVGNGQVLSGANVTFTNGKITDVGQATISTTQGVRVIDGSGKHLYPGLILSNSNLGLVEVPSVRATSDDREIGENNASVRALVAYNTDSKVINTLRPNGILLANVLPSGGWISGASSVVQLDAWNWEDAAYASDNAIVISMPALIARPRRFGGAPGGAPEADPIKQGLEQVDQMKQFFRGAKAYAAGHAETNLGFDAVQGLFNKSKKLLVRANTVRQMLVALDFVKEFGFDMVILGGSESWQIADLLAQNKVGVILNQMHSLPTTEDDDVDLPYKMPALLQKAGVLFAINDEDGQTRGRNLPFNAGTAAAYGLTKEQALTAITLSPAKLLGIADRTGSIEVGKDANLVLCSGDILDMRSNIISEAFIQGRSIPLVSKQTQLYDRYKQKYGLK